MVLHTLFFVYGIVKRRMIALHIVIFVLYIDLQKEVKTKEEWDVFIEHKHLLRSQNLFPILCQDDFVVIWDTAITTL